MHLEFVCADVVSLQDHQSVFSRKLPLPKARILASIISKKHSREGPILPHAIPVLQCSQTLALDPISIETLSHLPG